MTDSTDRILDDIDDVITWHGSRDSMACSANELKPPDLSAFLAALQSNPEPVRAFAVRMTEQMRIITEALQPLAEQMIRNARTLLESPGWRQLTEFANSPEGRAYIDAYERGEIEPDPPSCNCPCGAVHRDRMGICEHDAVAEIVRVSPSVGRVEIPVCGPCRDASMVVAGS